MQTKKRAKPVKFGSAASAKEKQAKESTKASSQKAAPAEGKKTKTPKADDSKIKSVAQSIIADSLSPKASEEDIDIVIEVDQEFSDLKSDPTEESQDKEDESLAIKPKNEKPEKIKEESTENKAKKNLSEAVESESEETEYPSTEEDLDTAEVESASSSIDQDGAFFGSPPDVSDGNKKSMIPYFFLITFVTFVLGLVFFAGIYYAVTNRGQGLNLGFKPTPEPTKEVLTTPTEKPVDLSKYSINVQNGTSVAGVAAKVRTQLTEAGFKVGGIGNADKDTYSLTQIQVSKKVEKDYIEKLKGFLKKSYQLAPVSTLASTDSDVVIKIGSTSAK